MNNLKLIVRNMRRNLRRTLLTGLTIALSTFIFAVLISVPASMDRIVEEASTGLRVVVNNRTGPWYDLPIRYCDEIEKMPGVVACSALHGWPAKYRDARDGISAFAATDHLVATDPDYRPTADSLRYANVKRAAVAGSMLIKKYHWKIGQEVTLRGTSADQMELSFILAGEIPSKRYPNSFVFRWGYLDDAYKARGDDVNGALAWFLFVRVDRAENVARVISQIDETYRNSDYETRTVTESDLLSTGLSAVGNIRGIIYSIAIVVLLSVLLIAANAMAMMVRDRISEVAVMRALGFGRGVIGNVLLGEAAMIGLLGGVLGAGLALWMFAGGFTLTGVIGNVGYLTVSVGAALEAVAVAVVISLVSAVMPVVGALRVAPALAFRQVV